MNSIYDNLGVKTTEELLNEMETDGSLKSNAKEEMLEVNINLLEKQLNEANIRIHKLHDVIEEMKQLSQSSIDNLIKSLDTSNKRWNTIEDHYGWNKYKE
jgi:predicted RNase H-like nuclease (RuvC/YqgF family)